jgi:hypothetical protein
VLTLLKYYVNSPWAHGTHYRFPDLGRDSTNQVRRPSLSSSNSKLKLHTTILATVFVAKRCMSLLYHACVYEANKPNPEDMVHGVRVLIKMADFTTDWVARVFMPGHIKR